MKKLIAVFGLLAMAACGGGDEPAAGETDAAAEPGAVVAEPVTPAPTTMPADSPTAVTGAPATMPADSPAAGTTTTTP